jgi:murein DD-endopeptidase MepM/ murein hydrolase activator NlpD
VKFTISPFHEGKVVYQKLSPPVAGDAGGGMIYFMLKAKNQTTGAITARQMVVSFPDTTIPPVQLASRDVLIGAGKTESLGLEGPEAIALPGGSNPSKLQITLTCDGLAEPAVATWNLAPHATVYDFFMKPEAGDYGEFAFMPANHMGGGSSQHFGYDVKTVGVNHSGKLAMTRNGSSENTDYFLWGRPLYAMADGIVVRAIDEHEDNPGSGKRTVARKAGSYQGTAQIDAVSVANLSGAKSSSEVARMFVAFRTAETIRGVVLEQNGDGSELTHLSGTVGGTADGSVCATGISERLAVTVHSNGGHTHLVLWGIATDGSSTTIKDTKLISQLTDARVAKLTSNRVAVLGKTSGGDLSLSLHSWEAGSGGSLELVEASLGTASGGGVEKMDLISLSSTRLAAALQTSGGDLKVIVWDQVPDAIVSPGGAGGVNLQRVGEAEGQGKITDVSIASEDGTLLLVAVRTTDGPIKVITWEVMPSGALERRGDATDEAGTNLDISFFKSSAYALTYRTESGKLRLVAWEAVQDETTKAVSFKKIYQRETDGTTNLFAITRMRTEQPTIVTAVKTQTGVLKVILWQFTDSNAICILHGSELAVFAHLQENSIPNSLMTPGTPVSKGQMIGRMGHSGKSSAPHTHFHVLQVSEPLASNVDQLIESLEVGKDDIGEFRPVHFRDVRAMRFKNSVSGWSNNPMTLLNGQGTYFEDYIIWPAEGDA